MISLHAGKCAYPLLLAQTKALCKPACMYVMSLPDVVSEETYLGAKQVRTKMELCVSQDK